LQDIFHEGLGEACSNAEAMQDLTVKRTLVKSPPELWSELSEVERLARHLGAFGEIKITRLEPERTVAWEGEGASGTVSIEPSGWGTKVVLTATIEGEEPPPEPEPEPEPSSEGVPEEAPDIATDLPEPPVRKRGWFGRLFGWERRESAGEPPVWVAGGAAEAVAEEPEPQEPAPVVAEEPAEPIAEPVAEPVAEEPPAEDGPAQLDRDGAQAALESALEALGSAHHRPFSRG
jgi:hypothetical protein